MAEMRRTFLAHAADLWDEWQPRVVRQMVECGKARMTFNFPVTLDFRETTPAMTVGTKYTRAFGNKLEERFDDPKQLGLEPIKEAGKGRRKGKA